MRRNRKPARYIVDVTASGQRIKRKKFKQLSNEQINAGQRVDKERARSAYETLRPKPKYTSLGGNALPKQSLQVLHPMPDTIGLLEPSIDPGGNHPRSLVQDKIRDLKSNRSDYLSFTIVDVDGWELRCYFKGELFYFEEIRGTRYKRSCIYRTRAVAMAAYENNLIHWVFTTSLSPPVASG